MSVIVCSTCARGCQHTVGVISKSVVPQVEVRTHQWDAINSKSERSKMFEGIKINLL